MRFYIDIPFSFYCLSIGFIASAMNCPQSGACACLYVCVRVCMCVGGRGGGRVVAIITGEGGGGRIW